jgi:hypothetical protein
MLLRPCVGVYGKATDARALLSQISVKQARVNKPAEFSKIRRNGWNRSEQNSKIGQFTVCEFKILKNVKKKYYKKPEQILSILMNKFFQIYIVWMVKI